MTDDFEGIHSLMDEMFAEMEQMTKEERLKRFKREFLHDFIMEDGDTTYIVRTHCGDKATESLQEKAERLISEI